MSVYFTANVFFENRRISFYSFIFAFLLLLSTTELIVEGVGIFSYYNLGLFTNVFAWPLLIFLLGFLEQLRKKKGRILFFLSVLFLSLLILTHILTTVFAFYLIFVFLLINIKDFDFIKKVLFIIGLSLFFTAFWWYPFVTNIYYTSGFDTVHSFNRL